MGSIYDEYYNQASDLENTFHDRLDDHYHPQAVMLRREIQELAQGFRAQKNPRTLEDQLKTIDRQLQQARSNPQPVMDHHDIDDLQNRFRRMRDNVRKFPNY